MANDILRHFSTLYYTLKHASRVAVYCFLRKSSSYKLIYSLSLAPAYAHARQSPDAPSVDGGSLRGQLARQVCELVKTSRHGAERLVECGVFACLCDVISHVWCYDVIDALCRALHVLVVKGGRWVC